MDIVTLYNYRYMKSKNIIRETFDNMKNLYWEFDSRSNAEQKIIKKVFTLSDGTMYRVLLRFTMTNVYEGIFELDKPVPFVIMQTEHTSDNKGFKDIKVFHGRKAKNVLGYMELGIPSELFGLLYKELRETLKFK